MTDVRVIHDLAGRPGVLEADENGRARIRLPEGAALDLPSSLVSRTSDGFRAEVRFADLEVEPVDVLHEVEETIRVGRRIRETGRVVAKTVTETRDEAVDAAGWRETVEVERVPRDLEVDSVQGVRVEDGVTIVPVYEEVLVVQKKLVLREELHLTTRREPVSAPTTVTLRRQHVEVERHPPSDAGPATD